VSPQAAEIIQRIYAHHAAGCCWHVVLDDGNWESIEFCREWALKTDEQRGGPCETRGACQELAALDLTPSILARAWRKARIGGC
jgi:hypothetical protein